MKKAQNSKRKRQNFTFYFLVVVFTFYFLLFTFTKVVSGQSLGLGIWPPLLEVMIQPGKSITQVYRLSNQGEVNLALVSKIISFQPQGEMGDIELLSVTSPPWLSFQNADLQLGQKFVLTAEQTQEVVLKIKVPEDAPEQDYYLTLLFETLPGVNLNQISGSSALAKIGSNILLTISKSGSPGMEAEIVEFGLKDKKIKLIDSFDQPEFMLRIKNIGSVFFKPVGQITVSGWGQSHQLDLLPDNVLTDSVRQIRCQQAEQAVPCQLKQKFMLGRYQAKLELGLNQANGEYQASFVFWALPLKLILGLLITLSILGLILRSKRGLTSRL